MQHVALDACCLINLCAAGGILGAESVESARRTDPLGRGPLRKQGLGFRLNLYVPRQVVEETLFLMQPDEEEPNRLVKTPIDLQRHATTGAIQACSLAGLEELALFVRMAVQLGDGEAACYAIAKSRSWLLGTDDRRAGKLAADAGIRVITTPELIRLWAEDTLATDTAIAAALCNIQRLARFVPRSTSPEYDWWMDHSGDAPS